MCSRMGKYKKNEGMKQFLFQKTPEQLQAKHIIKAFKWFKNNITFVLLKPKLSYLLNELLELKSSWSLRKRKEKKSTFLEKTQNIIIVVQVWIQKVSVEPMKHFILLLVYTNGP